jgi:hypothetical protein
VSDEPTSMPSVCITGYWSWNRRKSGHGRRASGYPSQNVDLGGSWPPWSAVW